MKKNLKLYYADIGNMGDRLNLLIVERVFGLAARRRSFLTAELSAIGSGLDRYTLHGSAAMQAQQRIYGVIFPRVYIWGTGFINYCDNDPPFFKRDMRFCAVRGELSRRRAEKLMGRTLDIPTGDGGILCPLLLDSPVVKKYGMGIVPHICDLNDPAVEALAEKYENSVIINAKDDPIEVLRQIAACRAVLSSSLHGLVAADAFGVPNRHMIFSDRPLGDGFKFDDYYSAYGVEHIFTDLRQQAAPSFSEVVSGCPVTPEMVETKKRAMLAAFPPALI